MPAPIYIGKKSKPKLPPIDTSPFVEATRTAQAIRHDGWTRLVLPYPPLLNHAYGYNVIGGGKKRFVKPYMKPEGREYQKAVGDIALAVGMKPFIGKVHLVIDVYRPRAVGDLDGVFKILLDSLPDIAYLNDSQISGICANRHDDANNPRAVVAIKLAGGETLNFEEFLK